MAHKALRCRTVSRSDFRVTNSGEVYFLETNAQPGLVRDWSLLPLIAKANGIEYKHIIQTILRDANYECCINP
uniref:ATP-grasp domain-containing protein n=1 Tax=Ditylenchus dipsaci TaxID=166011 RepID=A0A915DA23_9BILA